MGEVRAICFQRVQVRRHAKKRLDKLRIWLHLNLTRRIKLLDLAVVQNGDVIQSLNPAHALEQA